MHATYGDLFDKSSAMNELIYADDTLLIDSNDDTLQLFLDSIAHYGETYGLQLNWKKVELLPINSNPYILYGEGNPLEHKESDT